MRNILVAVTFIATCLLVSPLQAMPIPVGTSSGTLAVHYNTTGGEVPSNIAYIKSQFSETNTNGAAFSIDPIFAGIFGDVGQFGFDLLLELPTHDGSLDPLPFPMAVDNIGGGASVDAGLVAFALNDYKPDAIGPGVDTNSPINSLFRGTGIDLTSLIVTPTLTGFMLDIAGILTTDGLIHWFDPLIGTASLADVGLNDFFTFEGSFEYVTADDTTPGIDFYTGEATFFASAVPEPSSAILLFLGAAGFAGVRRRRKAQVTT